MASNSSSTCHNGLFIFNFHLSFFNTLTFFQDLSPQKFRHEACKLFLSLCSMAVPSLCLFFFWVFPACFYYLEQWLPRDTAPKPAPWILLKRVPTPSPPPCPFWWVKKVVLSLGGPPPSTSFISPKASLQNLPSSFAVCFPPFSGPHSLGFLLLHLFPKCATGIEIPTEIEPCTLAFHVGRAQVQGGETTFSLNRVISVKHPL